MAEGNLAPHRLAGGTHHSGATGKRESQPRQAKVSSPCGSNQRPWRSIPAKGLFPKMRGIADTSFIVAYADRNDLHHGWAFKVAQGITEPLLTCEAVLAESAFHLESSSYVLKLVQDEMLRIAFDCGENMANLLELAQRYRDRSPDLADLCLIRMSELNPRHAVITVDENDFRVYRRNKREIIPLLCPPRAH
jgi:uncharacterized protein